MLLLALVSSICVSFVVHGIRLPYDDTWIANFALQMEN